MKTYSKVQFMVLFLAVGLAVACFPAHAVTLSFDAITHNNAISAAAGEGQLFVDVTSYGTNQVLFTFRNTGPAACSIVGIYFDTAHSDDDDGSASSLYRLAGLIDKDDGVGGDAGVDFSPGGSPSNVPGWNTIHPNFSPDFRVRADNPASSRGVNPGESLGVIFTLARGKNLDSVLHELALGDLRIALHVQSFAQGTSESFVNNPPRQSVPEPATIGLLAAAVASMAGARKKNLI